MCLTCLRALGFHRFYLLTCLTYLLALVPLHLTCLHFLRTFRAFTFYVPYVPWFFTRITCLHIFTFLLVFSFLRALRVLSLFFRAFNFLRPWHAFSFSSVSSFWRALCAFTFYIKYVTTHNQPQQIRISKNKVKQTKNSLNEPKPTPGNIWELLLIIHSFQYFLVTPCCKRFQHSLNLSFQMMLRSIDQVFSSALKVINILRFRKRKNNAEYYDTSFLEVQILDKHG